jgi:hypothetical protein
MAEGTGATADDVAGWITELARRLRLPTGRSEGGLEALERAGIDPSMTIDEAITMAEARQPQRPAPMRDAVVAAGRGIDWGAPGAGAAVPRPAGPPVGQQFAGPAYNPLANMAARYGAGWAAPAVNQIERGARGIGRTAIAATGIPAASEAGRLAAEGDWPGATGQALMAAPSRLAAIPGIMLSEATAQGPDPRLKTISDLNAEIARRERTLQSYGNRQFPSTVARQAANKIEQDAIATARARITALEGEIDQERKDAAAARRAEESAATARRQAEADRQKALNTPTGVAYPWAPSTAAATGLGIGGALAYGWSRGRVRAFERQLADLNDQWGRAVARAQDTTLPAAQRNAAANEARALRTQFERARDAGPGGHAGGLMLGAGAGELGFATPTAIDYLTSQPGTELRNYTMHSIDPLNNPGEVLGRYGLGLGLGVGVGHVFGSIPHMNPDIPTGWAGATESLSRRYQDRRPARRRK